MQSLRYYLHREIWRDREREKMRYICSLNYRISFIKLTCIYFESLDFGKEVEVLPTFSALM